MHKLTVNHNKSDYKKIYIKKFLLVGINLLKKYILLLLVIHYIFS